MLASVKRSDSLWIVSAGSFMSNEGAELVSDVRHGEHGVRVPEHRIPVKLGILVNVVMDCSSQIQRHIIERPMMCRA